MHFTHFCIISPCILSLWSSNQISKMAITKKENCKAQLSLNFTALYSSHFHSASEFWRNPLNVKLLNRVDYFRRTKTLFQIIMHFYAPVSNYLRYHLEPPDLNLTFICRNNFFRAFPPSISARNVWWCFPLFESKYKGFRRIIQLSAGYFQERRRGLAWQQSSLNLHRDSFTAVRSPNQGVLGGGRNLSLN